MFIYFYFYNFLLGYGTDLYGPKGDYWKFDFYTHALFECYSAGICLGAYLGGTSYENSTSDLNCKEMHPTNTSFCSTGW